MGSLQTTRQYDVLCDAEHDPEMLFNYILRAVDSYYAAAEERRTTVKASNWPAARERIKTDLKEMIGSFPPRTPLKPRTAGRIQRKGYVIEKVIFESQPTFYVTANLYLPRGAALPGEAPVPGILAPCGHSQNGKAFEVYQHYYISLALKGYAVLAYDPLGQGERLQLLDPKTNQSRVGVGTTEHCYLGNRCYLIGENLALYRIWDGIRAIDYLCSRPEIDPRRIGCTGNSGGGTLTTYIAALDNRVKVAVPGCYITTLRERIRSRVTADPEQNFVSIVARGLDHGDMLTLVAPGAVMIVAAAKDYFPIEGTRAAYEQVRDLYGKLGLGAKAALVEVNQPHGFHKKLREAMYGWMNKWFGIKATHAEPPHDIENEKTLQCTKTGQVLSSLGGETVLTLLQQKVSGKLPTFATPATSTACKRYQNTIRKRMEKALAFPDARSAVPEVISDKKGTGDLMIERVAIESEPGILVPGLIFKPTEGRGPLSAVLCVHEDGKCATIERLQALARAGFLAFAIDPRGMGETKSRHDPKGDYYRIYGVETDLTYASFMIGQPLLGMRVFDVVRSAHYLRNRPDVDGQRIFCWGVGSGGVMALHAGALDKDVAGVIAESYLSTYRCLFDDEVYDYHVNVFLPSVLKFYDLPDAAACIAPRPLLLLNPLDHARSPLAESRARREYVRTSDAFRAFDAKKNLLIKRVDSRKALSRVLGFISK